MIGTAILIIGWKESRCERQEKQCRAYYAARESRLSGFSVDGNAAEQEAIGAACEPDGYFCRLFSAANLPTWLLVFVGLGGVWAALRTIGTLEKQADAGKDAAKAAVLSAQAVINSERAWIDGQFVKNVDIATRYILSIKNYGKTPAMVSSLELRFGHPAPGEKLTNENMPGESYESLHITVGSEQDVPLRILEFNDMFHSVMNDVPLENGMIGTIRVIISYGDVVSIDPEERVHRTEFAYEYNKLLETIKRLPLETTYT